MRRTLLGVLTAVAASSACSGPALAQSGAANVAIDPARGANARRPQALALATGPRAATASTAAHRPARPAIAPSGTFDPSLLRAEIEASRFNFHRDARPPRDDMPAARIGQNLDGRGPSGYYGGARLHAYHPDVRSGTHANANIVATRGHCNPARHQILTARPPVERPAPPRTASAPIAPPAAPLSASPGD